MKKIDYERGLVRMAWTLGILGGIGLFLFLLPYLPAELSLRIISRLFLIIFPLSLIDSTPAGEVFIFLLGITIIILLIRFFIKGFRSQDSTEYQEAGTLKINRRIILSALIIVLVGFGGGGFLIYSWYWQTHTGSRSGQVIDANTGKPIEGAVVEYSWRTVLFLEGALGSGGGGPAVTYETLTDKEGKYYIPNLRIKRKSILELGLRPDDVLIYKDGYAAYFADLTSIESPVRKPLGYPNVEQIYRKKNNIAKLYPWKEGESHYRHLNMIRGSYLSEEGELLRKELEPEKKRAEKDLMKDVEAERNQVEQEREKRRQK